VKNEGVVIMSFCTQCGSILQDSQPCECITAKEFCTQCGNKLLEGQACDCTADAKSPEQAIPSPFEMPPIPAPKRTRAKPKKPNTSTYVEKPSLSDSVKKISETAIAPPEEYDVKTSIVPDLMHAISDETPVKQYHIANLRNMFRITSATGQLQVTNKRVIFSADNLRNGKTITQREYDIEKIAGVELTSKYRLSLSRLFIGLVTVTAFAAFAAWVILAITHGFTGSSAASDMYRPSLTQVIPWALDGLNHDLNPDINFISIVVGLVVGFAGIVFFALMRGMFWLKQILLGTSLGGLATVALTYSLYGFVLLALSVLITCAGLVLFSWLPDLTVLLRSKEGATITMVRGWRITDAFHSTLGAGYAEAAPAGEAELAIHELGAIIRDIQTLGSKGVANWAEK